MAASCYHPCAGGKADGHLPARYFAEEEAQEAADKEQGDSPVHLVEVRTHTAAAGNRKLGVEQEEGTRHSTANSLAQGQAVMDLRNYRLGNPQGGDSLQAAGSPQGSRLEGVGLQLLAEGRMQPAVRQLVPEQLPRSSRLQVGERSGQQEGRLVLAVVGSCRSSADSNRSRDRLVQELRGLGLVVLLAACSSLGLGLAEGQVAQQVAVQAALVVPAAVAGPLDSALLLVVGSCKHCLQRDFLGQAARNLGDRPPRSDSLGRSAGSYSPEDKTWR